VKAILFDLYETLITETDTAPPRASKLGPALGLDYNAFRKEWKQQRPRLVRGELTFTDALTEIGARLGAPLETTAVQRVREERMRAKEDAFRRLRPEIVDLANELSTRGIRLGVVSNCWAEDAAPWPTCALAPHFAATAFSFEIHAAKPDPAIYLEALRRLRVDPREAIYAGDGADDELGGAERVGMRAARARWFIDLDCPATFPQLRAPRDVLGLVAAGPA
jgi:putative hydrolase of the HAD superfamily